MIFIFRCNSKGFSLIELLAVVTIISALSVMVVPRLDFIKKEDAKPSIVYGLKLARSLALYSSSDEGQVQFSLINNNIRIQKNNVDVSSLGFDYPKIISKSSKHEPQSIVLSFNSRGETQKTTIILMRSIGRSELIINATGYIE